MASDSNKMTFYLFFVLFSCHFSLVYSSASFQGETRVTWQSVKGLFRHKRQLCSDGTYNHEGRICCLCGAGQRVETHCTTKPDDGKCDFCEPGTYSSVPTAQQFCERCRSCDHPNTNLEVAEPCTRARDTKCRCKKGHFCTTNIETCRLCHPCQECGTEGIRVPCTATNDTICNERNEGGNRNAIIAVIIVAVLFICFMGALAFCWKNKILCFKRPVLSQNNGPAAEVELQPLRDIQQHLPELAQILGWKDMRNLALSSGLTTADVDNCEQSHPGDKEEQIYMLLRKFVEKKGKAASANLISFLEKKGKRDKVEKVSRLLCDGNGPVV